MNNVLIIAEAGVNHNGSIENAKKLIDVAAQAGVDYVKFQILPAKLPLKRNIRRKIIIQKVRLRCLKSLNYLIKIMIC